jgi:hypothetical protein
MIRIVNGKACFTFGRSLLCSSETLKFPSVISPVFDLHLAPPSTLHFISEHRGSHLFNSVTTAI